MINKLDKLDYENKILTTNLAELESQLKINIDEKNKNYIELNDLKLKNKRNLFDFEELKFV
jgi:hypothetical protein